MNNNIFTAKQNTHTDFNMCNKKTGSPFGKMKTPFMVKSVIII